MHRLAVREVAHYITEETDMAEGKGLMILPEPQPLHIDWFTIEDIVGTSLLMRLIGL